MCDLRESHDRMMSSYEDWNLYRRRIMQTCGISGENYHLVSPFLETHCGISPKIEEFSSSIPNKNPPKI